jgi:hypothetical protein
VRRPGCQLPRLFVRFDIDIGNRRPVRGSLRWPRGCRPGFPNGGARGFGGRRLRLKLHFHFAALVARFRFLPLNLGVSLAELAGGVLIFDRGIVDRRRNGGARFRDGTGGRRRIG